MSTLNRPILFVMLLALVICNAQAEDLCEISMKPLKETFLYGTEPAILMVFKNIADDTISVRGVWDGDHYAVIDLAIEDDIDLTNGDVSLHGNWIKLAPGESYSEVASLSRYRISDRRSHHETDPAMKWAYPLGHFMAKAIIKCQKMYIPQYYYPSCTYRVEMPTSEEDKVVLDSIRLANEYTLKGDSQMKQSIYQMLYLGHPNTPYKHRLFDTISGGFIGLYREDYGKSIEPRYEWAIRYLNESDEYFPEALNTAIGSILDHYRQLANKQDCINRIEEIKLGDKATIYQNFIDYKISFVQRQRPEEFNRVNY